MKRIPRNAVKLISDILMSVMLVTCAVLLCSACLSIYRSAPTQMFTYEKIGNEWSKIALPIYITLAFIALRAVISCIEAARAPDRKEKLVPARSKRSIVKRLSQKADVSSLSQEDLLSLSKERKLRRILLIADISLCALCSFLPLVYVASPERYLGTTSSEITKEVLTCIIFLLVFLLPSAIFHILYGFLSENSFAREHEILKKALRSDTAKNTASTSEKSKISLIFCIRLGVFALAVTFIVLGALNGGMQDVLKKAAEICAECIGLG